jgi:uncharacterized protein (DUF849 family)
VRTGLEDNIRITRDRLGASNAELVGLAAEAVARHGRPVATPAQARTVLGLAAECQAATADPLPTHVSE